MSKELLWKPVNVDTGLTKYINFLSALVQVGLIIGLVLICVTPIEAVNYKDKKTSPPPITYLTIK